MENGLCIGLFELDPLCEGAELLAAALAGDEGAAATTGFFMIGDAFDVLEGDALEELLLNVSPLSRSPRSIRGCDDEAMAAFEGDDEGGGDSVFSDAHEWLVG